MLIAQSSAVLFLICQTVVPNRANMALQPAACTVSFISASCTEPWLITNIVVGIPAGVVATTTGWRGRRRTWGRPSVRSTTAVIARGATASSAADVFDFPAATNRALTVGSKLSTVAVLVTTTDRRGVLGSVTSRGVAVTRVDVLAEIPDVVCSLDGSTKVTLSEVHAGALAIGVVVGVSNVVEMRELVDHGLDLL